MPQPLPRDERGRIQETRTWKTDAVESTECVVTQDVVLTRRRRQTLVHILPTGGATEVSGALAGEAIECVLTDSPVGTGLGETLVDVQGAQPALPARPTVTCVAVECVNTPGSIVTLVVWCTVVYVLTTQVT